MSEEEYLSEKARLQALIEFNERIHCYRVAKKYRRYLERLESDYNDKKER